MAPVTTKSLSRLSREGVIDLALSWLDERHTASPYLLNNRRLFEADEEDYLHAPAESVAALRTIYRQFRRAGAKCKKQEVIDRIVDGDWRRGLSLHQHASIDFACLEQNDTALRWSALRLIPLARYGDAPDEDDICHSKKRRKLSNEARGANYPQMSAQTFFSALQAEISPLVKAHYHVHRMPAPYNLSILRLYIAPDAAFRPRSSAVPRCARDATDGGRVMYIALPDSCPYVYVSLSGSSGSGGRRRGPRDPKGRVIGKVDMATMKRVVLEAIPKALSRPHERWALESTNLTAKSLRSLCELRGNQNPGTGGGAYSHHVLTDRASDSSPINVQVAAEGDHDGDLQQAIHERFGYMKGEHYAALDRVYVKIENTAQNHSETSLDAVEQGAGHMGLAFSGSDVFLGLRKLAELGPGYVNLDKMPAPMTGELGVSTFTI